MRVFLGLTAVALSATLVLAQAAMPAKVGDTAMGKAMTNGAGMTLYTFDRDSAGKSACNGPCAQNWLPFAAMADAKTSGDWSVIARDDGAKQWAYKGKPLYAWTKDAKAGDTTGDGVNGVWHIAKP